jgi:ATP-binding cassette subfamily C (CFTR/MRP) protein 4
LTKGNSYLDFLLNSSIIGSSAPSFESYHLAMATTNQPCESVQRPKNPLVAAPWWSKLFFLWPYPLLKLGMSRPLEELDLPQVTSCDESDFNRDYLMRLWEAEKKRRPDRPSLHRVIAKDFFQSIWIVQPLMGIAAAARVIQAVVLGFLINFFGGENDRGWLWASILVLCGLIVLFEHHHVFFITWRKGMQVRIGAVAAIHDKALKLSSTHQDTSASYGKIMNLASNDVERFLLAALFISHLFWAPLQAIAILAVGCWLVGPAFAAGFALLLVVFVPLQFYLSRKFGYYRSKIAHITDQRVTFVSQAIRGARVMKMSGYEQRFLDRIMQFRSQEVHQIAKANTLKSWNEALFFATNVTLSLVIFLVKVFTGGTLDAGDVFTVFTLVNILQLEMSKHVSLGVMAVSEVYVSIQRIQRFFEYPEHVQLKQIEQMPENARESVVIAMEDVICYWNDVQEMTPSVKEDSSTDESSRSFLALESVSATFRKGELTAVLGLVGQGKSAMLSACVQELPVASGSITRNYHTLSYACQDPWIMDGTVKENILMGFDFNESWYDQVVQACGLVLDFQQLRDGDQTIVGDRGVQCSGGQRARIGLARAIYRDADVLVADDPLSAVDAKVGRQLFNDAVLGLAVNRGKCVILATHQHQYISQNRCILMKKGRIGCIGSYEDCVKASNGELHAHTADDSVDNLAAEKETKPLKLAELDQVDELEETVKREDDNKETSLQGVVKTDTYRKYMNAMGGLWVGAGLVLLFSVTQASVLLTITYVGKWARRPSEEQDDWDIVGFIIGMGGLVIFLAIFRAYVSFRLTIKASQRLHDRMAKAVLRAKIEFFDTNPLGRIMNRFSADVGSNDDLLPPTLFDFFVIAFIVFGALIVTIISLPFTLLAVPLLMWYFWSVRRIFVTSSRELKRLEGLARSPIFAMLSESMGGIATIRSNNAIGFFQAKFKDAHDAHSRAFFAFIAASRWVGFRMDSIVFLFVVLVSYLSVLFHVKNWFPIDPTILGLSLSMLLQLAGMFQWCIRQSAEAVNQMVSVERVLAFGDLEPEAALELGTDKAVLDQGWPTKGSVDYEDLSVRYRSSLPLALDNVSFSIPGGARVGIVGRTGSGKSTIVQTFFRLLEAETGRILIDGEDISKLGLHTLRTRLAVIPQVPTLFSGCTVRENLDLFGLHSDDSLREVLKDCHMDSVVDALPLGWDSIVSENGSNFSVGQRQLLCLARAVLNKAKILVLDEATASVDRRTDKLLHEALHKSFHDGTILAVAHRLDTIIEHDFILVLGGGKVLEFGTPASLIESNGHFANMVKDTGDTSASELRRRSIKKAKMTESLL